MSVKVVKLFGTAIPVREVVSPVVLDDEPVEHPVAARLSAVPSTAMVMGILILAMTNTSCCASSSTLPRALSPGNVGRGS